MNANGMSSPHSKGVVYFEVGFLEERLKMAKKTTSCSENLLRMYKTLLLDLPLAGAKWGLGRGGEKEVIEAVWKSYDAAVQVATTAIDNLYRNPLFGNLLSRSLYELLRWQRLSEMLAEAFFTELWKTVGIPTAAEVQALREEIHSLKASRLVLGKKREALTKELVAARGATVNLKAWQETLEALQDERLDGAATDDGR